MADLYPNPSSIIAFAGQQTQAANNFIISLGQTANNLVPPSITPEFPTVVGSPAPVTTTPPVMQPVIWTAPAAPDAFTRTLNVDSLMPEPFDDAPPTLIFGSPPAPINVRIPDAPGINVVFDYPDLDVTLPAPPSLLSLTTYSFDGVSMPTITTDVPELSVPAPGVVQYVPGSMYTSSLLETLKAELDSRISIGGTGLKPEIEQAIWDRGRERENKQLADAIADLERMETLGYAFPPGVYMDARLKIQTEFGKMAAGHSREVMIKQAELELDNIKSALTMSVQLEGTLITYNNQVEQRLFDSSKYATEAGISVYNARVQAYSAYLDAYKTKIAIYEAQIRGELAKVEAYKAEVAAEQAKSEINTALVNQFKVRTDAALSAVEVFKAEIAAIAAKAEIEKIKVQIFGEQVRGYTAQVGAYTAGVEGFKASIQAEGTKQEAYKSKVSAYATNVEAATKKIEAKIKEYQGQLQAKTTEWDGYKAAYQGEAARAAAITATNATLSDAYKAEVAAVTGYNETMTKQWAAAVEQAQRVAEIGVSAAKSQGDLYLTTRSLALDAAKVGAQVSAQLGAAALNAINWSNSFASSVSSSTSTSNSSSKSDNTSTSTNNNYNYSV